MGHGTYESVMAHMDESWHICMSHGTYEYVTTHIDESCDMNESCHISINRNVIPPVCTFGHMDIYAYERKEHIHTFMRIDTHA